MTLHPHVEIKLTISYAGNSESYIIPDKRKSMPLSMLLRHSAYVIVESYASLTNVPEADITEQIQAVGRWLAETEVEVDRS